jgi:hypothetical protein
MASSSTRKMIDIAAFVAIAWMWFSIYESFTRTGLWPIVHRVLGQVTTLTGQAAVLATCVLSGWLALAAACGLLWRVFLRDRADADFPVARVV